MKKTQSTFIALAVSLLFAGPSARGDNPPPPVKGGLEHGVIDETVQKNILGIRDCYKNETANESKTPSGRVAVRFMIGSDGKVTKAEVENTTLSRPKVESCLLDAIKKIVFPEPLGGGSVEVVYPFQFSADAKDAKPSKKNSKKKKADL